jgi:hypothetical protein
LSSTWRLGPVTAVVAVAVLVAGSASGSAAAAVAVLTTVPAPVALTTSCTVAVAPAARLPSAQLTGFRPLQPPWLAVAETSVTPAGSGSVTVTPVAAPGPWLVTVIV